MKQFTTLVPSSFCLSKERHIKSQQLLYKTIQMTDGDLQAINDKLIVDFAAERMSGAEHDAGRLTYLSQGVRDLSRLLTEMKSIDEGIQELSDCFACDKFDTLMQAVYNIPGTNFEQSTVEKTSFNIRLRNPIGLCVVS